MATNPSTLSANSVCAWKCIPDGLKLAALIKLLADVAGVPTTAAGLQDLLFEARCISRCIPMNLQVSAAIAALYPATRETVANGESECVELISGRAVYQFGFYQIPGTVAGGQYQVTWGPTEEYITDTVVSIANPGAGSVTTFTAQGPCSFVASVPNGTAVSSTICEVQP